MGRAAGLAGGGYPRAWHDKQATAGPAKTPSAPSSAFAGPGLQSTVWWHFLSPGPSAWGSGPFSALCWPFHLFCPRHPDTMMSPCPDTEHRAQKDPKADKGGTSPSQHPPPSLHWLETASGHAAGRGSWGSESRSHLPLWERQSSGDRLSHLSGPSGRGARRAKRILLIQAPVYTHRCRRAHVPYVLAHGCAHRHMHPTMWLAATQRCPHLHRTLSYPCSHTYVPPHPQAHAQLPAAGQARLPVREAPNPAQAPTKPISGRPQAQAHRGPVLPPGGHLKNQT